MKVKKQVFEKQDLSMLFLAFTRNLFVRPTKGDISVVVGNESTLYFSLSYYDALKKDILEAYNAGKFSHSNAVNDWEQLMRNFLSATLVDLPTDVQFDDYCEIATSFGINFV